MQLLQSGDLDLGLGYLEELPKQISSAIVLSEPFILVLHEKHRAAKKRVVFFEDLKDDLLLTPRAESSLPDEVSSDHRPSPCGRDDRHADAGD